MKRYPELSHHNEQFYNLSRLQELTMPLDEFNDAVMRENYLANLILVLPLVVDQIQ